MHHTHRIALLEDKSHQLEKLELYLSQVPNIEIVLKSKNSDHFFEEIQKVHPEILVADLDLGNDSMTGMEVAQEIKIPVFLQALIRKNMWKILKI
ncbi:Response regulator receiver domain-containing protein [Chryseobacterium arachidis]|uniref:Response regulator receiver domain-containing protein n=1 Tax=Chryseobacterium arachidis TaxID=1416778 RepID=A0A1M5BQ26_9FLAO|nr:response regulator transcription factor [Chryseobacterium arachidis]SHF44703.1 Response regulator receiver domain-containing protein [Chryseobacterium arachidis]